MLKNSEASDALNNDMQDEVLYLLRYPLYSIMRALWDNQQHFSFLIHIILFLAISNVLSSVESRLEEGSLSSELNPKC
ncbi:hypothetical protein SCA6_008937 [Theobroma cacao]